MKLKTYLLPTFAILGFGLTACSQSDQINKLSSQNQDNQAKSVQFDEQRFRQDIKVLASDEFEGRAPTTKGETLTLEYLTRAFKAMGLEGANQGKYLQAVPMVSYTASDQQAVTLGGIKMIHKKDVVLGSRNDIAQVVIKNAPLVFVGYGINAPEYQWNDYQDIDVQGKIAVILVNDPGFARPDLNHFNGRAMTYYGRWDYKFKEASRQGALGAIIVHDTEPASYPWSVVKNSWTGAQQDLVQTNELQSNLTQTDQAQTSRAQTEPQDKPLLVEGWVSMEAATKLFDQSKLNLAKLSQQAAIKPVNHSKTSLSLKADANIQFAVSAEYANSYNVVATLPGTSQSDEHILFTAHWDHIGKDLSKEGDQIYNGALDNASGTAGIMEIARQFAEQARQGHKLKRSLTFIATTGEEQGLLGSRYYADHPLYPLDKSVAVLNLDSTNVYGKTKDYTIIGKGKSELENYLIRAATSQDRVAKSEKRPESGGFFRSDHFSFAKFGVPAVFAGGGSIPRDEATAEYKTKMKQEMRGCYHNTCDHYRPHWDLSGAIEDLKVFYKVAEELGNNQDWPGYYQGTEFYHLRSANSQAIDNKL